MEDESGREAEIMDITASDKERGVILVPTGLVLSILHFHLNKDCRLGAGALVFLGTDKVW